ncbi:MAG TPA: peptidoglycan DD-metalloendopeptidase family protein [Candidatus Saccharimonadales bacterium]
MPKLDEIQNANQQHDPYSNPEARELIRQEVDAGQNAGINAGIDQLESFANDPANSTKENINNTAGLEKSSPWANNVVGKGSDKKLEVSFIKRKGPLGAIIGLLVGGGGLAGFLLAPASLPVTMMEVLTNDTDDAATWNSNHVHKLFGKKLGGMQAKVGYCGKKVTVRCKFSTMSKWQANRFKAAGITFPDERTKGIAGQRVAFTTMEFKDPVSGETHTAKNPSELNKLLREKPFVRSMMYRGFNPMTGKFLGNRFTNVLGKIGLSKAKKIQGDTKEEADQSYQESNSDSDDEDTGRVGSADNDEEAKDNEQAEKDRQENNKTNNSYVDEINKSLDEGKSNIKIKAGNAVSIVQGVCAAYTIGSLISTASKAIKAARLAKFAMMFLTGAAAMKAGQATAAEVQKMTDVLVPSKFPEQVENNDGEMIDNPNIGKNALDSEAFRIIAYGDSGDLNQIAARFFIGGGVVGTLSKVINIVNSNKAIKGSLKTSCKVLGSKWATLAGLAASATGIGGIIAAAIGAAAGPFIEKALGNLIEKAIKWAAGKDLTTGIIGVDAGNAIFAGTAYIMSKASAAVGMIPGKAADIVKNMSANVGTQQTYIANERYNARNTPFDANNPYSFLGTVLTNIRGTASVRPLSQIQSIFTNSLNPLKFITQDANAAYSMPISTVKEDRFKHCDDPGYERLEIDADRFCNIRMIPLEEREIDSVLNYMEKHGDITEEGEPQSDRYQEWEKNCPDREAGWAEDSVDGSGDDGADCLLKTGDTEHNEKIINFANYRAYYGADQDMDEEPKQPDSQDASSSGGGKILLASFNVRGASHDGDSGTISYKTRMQKTVETIKERNLDIIGFQEFESGKSGDQRAEFNKLLGSTYRLSSNNSGEDNGNAIAWNSSKYNLIDQGTQPNLKYTVGNTLKAPWVKLKDKTTGQEFYFLNTHDPANVHDNPETKNAARRTENAKEHVKFAKELGAKDNIPILMTGDYNSSFKKRGDSKKGDVNVTNSNIKTTLPYCIMTGEGTIKNAFDTFKKRSVKCPNQNINWNKEDPGKGCSTQIDHLYYWEGSQPLSIDSFGCARKGDSKDSIEQGNGSDHDTLVVGVTIPGIGNDSEGGIGLDASGKFGKIAFPLKGTKSTVKNPSIFHDGNTAGGHDYTPYAYDIYAPAGTQVVAFASGEVTSLHSGSLGKGVSIYNKEAGLVVYYTHMANVSVKQGQTISPGDPVGTLASVKDYPGINVDHLHIDASTDKVRQACSRGSCSIGSHFRSIGKDLFNTYQALPR